MRRIHRVGACVVAAIGVLSVAPRSARACGGCFVPPPPPNITQSESVITDEKMILSISMNQTTLYDEIEYSGSPASFAWVLPIKGTVTVGLSADILFQTIGTLTATTVSSPDPNCPPAPSCGGGGGGGGCGASSSALAGFAAAPAAGGYAAADGGVGAANGVTVTSQKQVGPYETVQLHSNDGSALTNWLTSHGYEIPSYTKPIVDAYVQDGFDFLALKLIPGEGVQTMQPVRVTSQGAAPSLPLHMVAVGTGPTTGITIWIVADGRWQPSNFPTFTIQDSKLNWDWATSSSNYESLRLSNESALGGRGWQIESSLELSQYNIQQSLQQAIVGNTSGADGNYPTTAPTLDAGAADTGTGSGTGRGDAGASDSSTGSGEAGDGDGGDGGDGGYYDEVDGSYYSPPVANEVLASTADLDVLFAGISGPNVRITRMRSDVAKAALSVDMYLEAATDQSELSNQYFCELQTGEPLCPVYDDNCNQIGEAPKGQAQAASSTNGCATTKPRKDTGTSVGFVLALAGLTVLRARQKRASRRRAEG
jgi:Uncharacterized protein conserved in bacteria (DUF2330)